MPRIPSDRRVHYSCQTLDREDRSAPTGFLLGLVLHRYTFGTKDLRCKHCGSAPMHIEDASDDKRLRRTEPRRTCRDVWVPDHKDSLRKPSHSTAART